MKKAIWGGASGTLLILGAVFCWSTAGVLIKAIPWNAMSINCVRNILAVLTFIAVRRTLKVRFTKTNVTGGLLIVTATILYAAANKLTTAANAIALSYTSPVFIILITSLKSGRAPRVRDVLVVGMTLGGVVLCFAGGFGGGNLKGDIAAVLTGICMAGVYVVNAKPGATPMEANYLGFLLGSLTFPVLFFDRSVVTETNAVSIAAVIALGVVQLGGAYVLFSKGIQKVEPLRASLIASIEPIASPLWVFLILGEAPTAFTLLGGAVIVGAITFHNLTAAGLRRARMYKIKKAS